MINTGLFLAIDQSTSATKALLFAADGRLLDQETLSHQQIYPRAGWVEHDAAEIFSNTLQVASTLLNRHPDQLNSRLALSITNQRETFVVFDRETGQPLHNAIVWQCRRGAELCQNLVDAGKNDLVHELTGLKIDTYFPASKLRWLLDARPDLRDRLRDGSALFGTIDTYLIYRLTGGKVYATDHTNASRTLYYDIGKLAWSAELCDVFGLEFCKLPEVRESSAWFGDTDLQGCLNRPIPIVGVMGDSQASLFALRCFEPGAAKVTFGTGSSLLLNIGSQLRLSDQGIVSTIAWVLEGQAVYAFEGLINYSAATISWLKNQLKLINSAAETESLALEVEDNGGVYLVPAFVGLSAPYWSPEARAAILGMTPHSTRSHIVRAALEAIAYQIKDVLDLMVQTAGIPLQCIYADGGAVRNRFLMQFTADMIRYPVRVSDLAELSALGAVFCGMLGVGLVNSLADLSRLPRGLEQYEAQMDPERVAELYSGWQAAVKRVL